MSDLKSYQIQQQTLALELRENVFAPSAHGLYYANNVNIEKDEQVIDVGCGSGLLAVYAAKVGAHVHGTDITAAATALTKINAHHNGVTVDVATGGFFAGLKKRQHWHVVLANLPQEIIAPDYAKKLGLNASDIDGGTRGNDLVLELLRQAPDYLAPEGRLYLPLHTLSDYQHTLREALQRYQISLVNIGDLPAKPFVIEHLSFYTELARAGVIRLFECDGVWYTNVYVIELKPI